MRGTISHLRHEVRETVRSALWLGVGAFLMLVGVAFLTAAAWLALAQHQSALFATTAIGIAYVVVAIIVLVAGRRGKRAVDHPTNDPEAEFRRQPLVQIAEGFAIGMRAGRAARSGRG